jgi:hypothetical protein
MLLAYLDESYTKDLYLIAALVVPEDVAQPLTAALDDVVRDVAWTHGKVTTDAELHGNDLWGGKRDWAPLGPEKRLRLGVYDKALQAIGAHDVEIVIRALNSKAHRQRYKDRAYPPHEVVLEHLCERIDHRAKVHDQKALMIADEVDDPKQLRLDLWHYQRYSTSGYRSQQIKHIVDTIHFAPSHASRLVQGADLLAFLARRRRVHTETDPAMQRTVDTMWSHIEPRIRHNFIWTP